MVDALNWFISNWETIAVVVGAVLTAASVITGLTPTPYDDGVVAFLRKALGWVSGLTHSDAPGTIKAPLVAPGDKPLMFDRTSRK